MDSLFFIASKTLGLAARAETWVLAGLLLALLAMARGRRRAAAVWTGLVFAALLALTVLPLGDLLLAPLERRYPAAPEVARVDGIIVLGGAEDIGPFRRWGGIAVNAAGERLTAAVALARLYPEARVIYTGGTARLIGSDSARDPSAIARDLWLSLGVEPGRIVLEEASRNTSENARLTRDLIAPQEGQSWLLVTSAFHMPRSMETFARAGWTGLTAWPVDFRSGRLAQGPAWHLDENLGGLDTALKEYLGLVAYRVAGK